MLSVTGTTNKTQGPVRVNEYTGKNPNGHVRRFLEILRNSDRPLPQSTLELLKDPTPFFSTVTKFDKTQQGRFLESLLENNILAQADDSTQKLFVSYINAAQVGALYHSLSDEDKVKFYKIVKAFDLAIKENPKLKESMTDMVIEGGEIRVASAGSSVMVINAITALLGVQLKNFYGASAGAFLALGQAVKAPNSAIFANCAYTKYESFYGNRDNLLDWLNFLANEGYSFNTGKHIDKVTISTLEELGTNFQAFISEHKGGNFLWPFTFRTEDYFLPEAFVPKFDDHKDYDLASLAAMSANLVCFFFWPWDTSFGNCSYKDPEGIDRKVVDPGTKRTNMLPIHALEEKIREHIRKIKAGEAVDEPPPFGFIVKNKAVGKDDIPRMELLQYKNHLRELNMISGFRRFLMLGFNVFSWLLDINQKEPWDKIKELGLDRATIESRCATRDPRTGNLSALLSGFLKMEPHAKEAIICSNIPTREFAESPFRDPNLEYSVMDQLCNHFVDDTYIETDGKAGRSPFDLYKQGIYQAFKIKEPETSIEIASPQQAVLLAKQRLEEESIK
ncbi:MAG: patatin-like phospholipase family protein [Candidatus Melainabacteria bacterium]|nr:patatin-like phospholipase family protein [Candidatus Melainabacteria bacterium]MBI3309300.1 patatin-like phospholipase family protein [Candidatus Melainabacteria bacterium]